MPIAWKSGMTEREESTIIPRIFFSLNNGKIEVIVTERGKRARDRIGGKGGAREGSSVLDILSLRDQMSK